MTRPRMVKVCAAALSLALGVGLGWALGVSIGCRAIESTADALADATEGSAVSGLFRGTARAAEGFRDYDPSEKYYIGRAVAAQLLSHYKIHPDKALQDYVNLVGLAVLSAPEAKKTLRGYRFIVLEGKEVQAVSAPGGFIFLTEGTVRKAKDEDELAAVLAHEIAHVSLDHGIESIKAATRKKSAALLTQSAGQVGVAAAQGSEDAMTQQLAELTAVFADAIQDVTTELLVKGFSRETELAADAEAVIYMKSSGYARAALVSYLRTLEKEGTGGEGGWKATHPSAEDRMSALAAEGVGTGSTPGRELRTVRFRKTVGGA